MHSSGRLYIYGGKTFQKTVTAQFVRDVNKSISLMKMQILQPMHKHKNASQQTKVHNIQACAARTDLKEQNERGSVFSFNVRVV